ncbi:MAG: hypothetical protein Hens2KO_25670 [Henriciella sp.]
MKPEDLSYVPLKKTISGHEEKGRGESVAFLSWFLENICRLDAIDADDAVCDKPNDKGIDGIYINHTQDEIWILQSKIRQKESSIGDAPLRELAGSITQLKDVDSVQALLDGGANEDLKRLLSRQSVKSLVEKGYSVRGVFVSNQPLDDNGKEFLDQDPSIDAYDRNRIAQEFIDIDTEGGVSGSFQFDLDYVEPMVIQTGEIAKTYIFPVKALELVAMEGIQDGSLFSLNVRQSLGNTKVNKALTKSVVDANEHSKFPLYHNGVTILCKKAEFADDKLTITDYVVVNGAQSISTFSKNSDVLTNDLRVLAKVIQLDDGDLSRAITVNSNNQNAIKPRDLKSTNDVQVRLREEFRKIFGGNFEFEIKRGQESDGSEVTITNEEAGRLLLAFDLQEPYSCHQVYKLFDDKYGEIFARKEVDAYRIVFLHKLMSVISETTESIEYKPLSKYGLTKFFLLSTIAKIMQNSSDGLKVFQDPKAIFDEEKVEFFLETAREILASIVIDLNYEVEQLGDAFDYKGDLKSPSKIRELQNSLMKSYEKDVARGKASTIALTK